MVEDLAYRVWVGDVGDDAQCPPQCADIEKYRSLRLASTLRPGEWAQLAGRSSGSLWNRGAAAGLPDHPVRPWAKLFEYRRFAKPALPETVAMSRFN